MTTKNIHSLAEFTNHIDTDIIVCNANDKNLSPKVFEKVAKKGIILNSSFMPLTVNLCLFLILLKATIRIFSKKTL